MKDYEYHTKNPYWSHVFPYRLEFQAKFDRQETGKGYSAVKESRFEFRKESNPFSEEFLPPPPPWNLEEFIPYFETGIYDNFHTLPAQDLYKYLTAKYDQKSFKFKPELVLLTQRYRLHLNINSPYGSGPNPDQAYIISLDQTDVYDSAPYLKFLTARQFGNKNHPEPINIGRILEIEVEFERNVSDILDQKIEENPDLSSVRDAFLKDQKNIMKIIKNYFAEKDVRIEPANKSKYVQAMEMK